MKLLSPSDAPPYEKIALSSEKHVKLFEKRSEWYSGLGGRGPAESKVIAN